MADENPYAPPAANIEVPQAVDGELAGRWARLGGSLIDTLIFVIVFWAAIFAFGAVDQVLQGAGVMSASTSAILLLGSLVLFALLNGFLLATRGQTIGKLAVGTRIVSFETGALVPLWKLMALRYLPYFGLGYIPFIGQIIGLINPLLIFKKDRRCLHDHLAGTKVVVANPLPAG